jgi:multidrug efflux pump subunit AcrB
VWIVRVALRRPYTFVVLALLILLPSPVVILRTPTDIFPNVEIPVIAVAFGYTGLNPEEMEERITTVFERLVTTVANDVEPIDSTTINGQAIVRIFLQPRSHLEARSIKSFSLFAQPPEMWRAAWASIFTLLKSGAIKPIVARTFALEDAAEALRFQIEGRPFGRVVLKI